jgi:prepilin-type N-terminal cleavage/methylation domain-containing protein
MPAVREAGGAAGFTLLELVIVMVIMGLAVGLVAPSLTMPMQRPKPPLASFLEAARTASIESGRKVAVYVEDRRLWREPRDPEGELTLPEEHYLDVDWPQPSPFLAARRLALFYADGTGVLGRFRLMRRSVGGADVDVLNLEIDPLHGEVHYAYP